MFLIPFSSVFRALLEEFRLPREVQPEPELERSPATRHLGRLHTDGNVVQVLKETIQ